MSFHSKTGALVTLANSNRTAFRNNPQQEFNHGLVMTSEPLVDDQLFEVRIDKKVPTWSGSIEIGVTSLDPNHIDFPSSATNLREGSWIMSGTSILEDGKSHLEEYGRDLDELAEGDTVGVMRSNGELHFYINGVDQGASAEQLTGVLYGVVDMYGKCAQVTIMEVDPKKYAIICIEDGFVCARDTLNFHEHRGTMVKLSNGNRTAERRKPVDEFNNGVVMTHRPVLDDELFEIRIDELVNKWSGSIEMGITTHNPDTLEFPATMTNLRSGTIMMSGCGILTNGKGSRREYGNNNLDELHEGDRIGLVRKSNKNLHYYINGIDQGIAAENVPSRAFGVVDLYGMTVKVTLTDYIKPTIEKPEDRPTNIQPSSALDLCMDLPIPILDATEDDDLDYLTFHERCGLHVNVTNGGKTAHRPNFYADFDHAIVITSRALRHCEMFEVVLEQIVMKWSGTIEIGVTIHSAEELDFPSTMTNVRSGTWMLTGNGVTYNGATILDDYNFDPLELKAGDSIGLIIYEDRTLHFIVNGVNKGAAASNIPNNVYGVVDLYGQAAKVSIVETVSPMVISETFRNVSPVRSCRSSDISQKKGPRRTKSETNRVNSAGARPSSEQGDTDEYSNDDVAEPTFSFHPICGFHVNIESFGMQATRILNYSHGLVFSLKTVEIDQLYEVYVFNALPIWGGTMKFGVTTYEPTKPRWLPESIFALAECDTWLIGDTHLYKNGNVLKRNYALLLPNLNSGDKIGLKIFRDNSLHFFLNGIDLGSAATNMPKNLRIVADIYGAVESISINNNNNIATVCTNTETANIKKQQMLPLPCSNVLTFHENHGKNIHLSNDNVTASRTASYNQGIVISQRALACDELFQVQIDNVLSDWSGSVRIGVTSQSPDQICLPISALSMRHGTWVISGDAVFYNGVKVKSEYGPDLNNIKYHYKVGVKLDAERNLHLIVNNVDHGVAAEEVSSPVYGFVDVYGKCKQVTISSEPYSFEDENDKEKANIEIDGEKVIKSISSSHLLSNNCDHKRICSTIKQSLALSESYFSSNSTVCFCENCHKERGDEPYYHKGDPPKEFAQPFGWCRFPVKHAGKGEKLGVNEKWHVAFHGTTFGSLRQVLESGRLMPSAMLGLKIQQKSADKSGKTEEKESSHVLISPTMLYAGLSKFSPKEEFRDSESAKLYQAQVAFQVYVRPGSYSIEPKQLDIRETVDIHFSNNDLEWYTKEEGSIILHSLLMRVNPV